MAHVTSVVSGSSYVSLNHDEEIKYLQEKLRKKVRHLFIKTTVGLPFMVLSAPFYAAYNYRKDPSSYDVLKTDKKIGFKDAQISSLKARKQSSENKEKEKIKKQVREFIDSDINYQTLLNDVKEKSDKFNELNRRLEMLIEDQLALINETGVAFEHPEIKRLKNEITNLKSEIDELMTQMSSISSKLEASMHQVNEQRNKQKASTLKSATRRNSKTIDENLKLLKEELASLKERKKEELKKRKWSSRFEKMTCWGAVRTFLQIRLLSESEKSLSKIELGECNATSSYNPRKTQEEALMPIRIQNKNLRMAIAKANR